MNGTEGTATEGTATKATFKEVDGFVREAQGYLPTIRQQLAAHTDSAGGEGSAEALHAAEALEGAYCHVQALRGASSMIGLKSLARLAFGLEAKLKVARDEGSILDNEAHRRMLTTLDDIALALAGFRLQANRVARARPRPADEAPVDDDGDELLEIFRLEAEEYFLQLARFFNQLNQHPGDAGALREIQRRAHTLKGAAGTAGLPRATALAHRMEDLLDFLIDGQLIPSAEQISLMLRTTDTLQTLIYDDVHGESLGGLPQELEQAYLRQLGDKPGSPALTPPALAPPSPSPSSIGATDAPQRTTADPAATQIRLPLDRFEELQTLVGELILNRGGLEQQVRGLGVEIEESEAGVGRLERLATWLEEEVTLGLPLGAREASGPAPTSSETTFDELEFDRYTELDVMSRHLVEVAADLRTVAADLGGIMRSLQAAVSREKGLSRQLESRMTQARLVRFATLVPRLQRTVRVTAARQAKNIEEVVLGQEVEVDKLVLEELAAPLQHLLRNAVDHGVEGPETRREAGKSKTGQIKISVARQGRQVVFEISDDGRGLNIPDLRRAAAGAGLNEGTLAAMSDRQAAALIFVPGLSTSSTVDEISGRGVGLDVVNAVVRQLGGEVLVDSVPGQGTRFTLRLPLSVASDRVLLVRAAGRTYAVPQAFAEQVLSLQGDAVTRDGGRLVLRAGGASGFPLLTLGGLLNGTGAEPLIDTGATITALVVERGEEKVAVAVDALLGSREVVVKPLAAHLRQVRGVLGATLLGDGQLVLILNPAELVGVQQPATSAATISAATIPHLTLPGFSSPAPSSSDSGPEQSEFQVAKPPTSILIADDSLSIRRALADSINSAGWQPITARDGQEALELLQHSQTRPEALVLDLEMPRMDGFELTSTLRARGEYATIPIIILTSRASEKHRQRALELGANEYLVKPYQEEVLLRTIRTLLGSTAD